MKDYVEVKERKRMSSEIIVPASVPQNKRDLFITRYKTITKNTQRLFMFAADQKMEHLNADFFGPNLPESLNNPDHIFTIAQQGSAGAFATHVGLIDRYATQYPGIDYIAKLDGKTNLSPGEPYSKQIWTVDDLQPLINNNVSICGVGYTIYLGSEYEREMLTEAATIVKHAHAEGLIAILWIYPRGKNVPHEKSPKMVAGAAGMAASLGADFVKVHAPDTCAADLHQAVNAAGTTKVVVSGGESIEPKLFMEKVTEYIKEGGVAGAAIGRNIFQHPLTEALSLSKKLADIIYG